jgi:hypothetical protein
VQAAVIDIGGGRSDRSTDEGKALMKNPRYWRPLLAMALAIAPLPFASATPIKLYIDESRSMQLGIQVWLSPRFSQAVRETRVTDLIALQNLRRYDAMVVWNQVESIPYGREELDAVKAFVTNGGGLLVIGTPAPNAENRAAFAKGVFSRPDALPLAEFSLNAMSALFGPLFSNATRVGSPEFKPDIPLTDVSTLGGTTFKQPLSCLVGDFRGAETIVSAFGHPVIVAQKCGKGRVIICGASRLFMKHGKLAERKMGGHDTEIAAQEDLLLHWLEWLSAGSPIRDSRRADLPRRIPGRVRLSESGLVIYTIPQLEPKARQLVDGWKKVWPELARTTGLSSPVELVRDATSETPLEVHLCASPAGGLSAANRIAIPAMGGDERLVGVLSHEVGHKLLGGCNTSVSEAFAEWLAMKGLVAAGFGRQAEDSLGEKLKAFRQEDPTGKKLDINNHATDATKSKACQGKWTWILGQLEREHGDTFLKNYLSALRQQLDLTDAAFKVVDGATQRLSMADHVKALSAAAGKDLSPWFKSLGITWTD